jgi:hypothetical protein
MVAQFLTKGVEDCLTISSEATEDQHRLLSNGVDNFADFRIIEQQINELRDLDVVDGDLGLLLRGDDQVLLLGPAVQLQAPRGYAVDTTAGEISASEIRVHQGGKPEVRRAEVRAVEVRSAEVRAVQVRPAEFRPEEMRPAEVSVVEVRAAKIGSAEARPTEVRGAKVGTMKVRAADARPTEVRPVEVRADVGILLTPSVPSSRPLPKLSDVFFIHHRSIPSSRHHAAVHRSLVAIRLAEQLRQPRDVDGDPPRLSSNLGLSSKPHRLGLGAGYYLFA